MKKLILIILVPNLLLAQNKLSLLDAIKIGLKDNYDIQISNKNYKINKVNNNWGNAGALPTVNISTQKEEALSDQKDNPASFIQQELRSSAVNGNANINWTLFSGFAIRANKKRLKNLENLSENNAILTIENTIQGIILQYYNCVLQKQRMELLKKVINLSIKRLEYEKTNYEIGISSKMDLLQTENAMLSDSSNLILQELNYKNAVKNLNLTIGRKIETNWVFTDEIDSDIQLFNFEELKRKTLANNTNITNQYYNIQLAKQDIELSKSVFYPTISINSGGAYNKSTYDIGEFSNQMQNTGTSINYFANFSINYRLFDGGKLYNTLRKVKIQKDINELRYDKVKEEVIYQLSLNYNKYNSCVNAFALNKKAFKIATLNYEIANDKKNRGIINSFVSRDIEIAYITSGINAQQSAYNLMESKIALLKISGGIIQDYN